jgi:oligopeptide/dipeptide ABC transporter ATP-binding protein
VPEIILEAHELSKSYGGRPALGRLGARTVARRPALDRVSVQLERGEVLGVVGESGSGKTTLARCLTMLVRPDAGRVVLEGRDLGALRGRALRAHRRRIQVIFQDPYASLNPRLSVAAALEEVLRVHDLVPRVDVAGRVAELLDLVGLSARAGARFPSDFSGGQRQRICIARALAAEPSVLVADEAVSALDVSIQAQVINLLLSLRDRLGLSIVFISHDLHLVRRVAPKIVVMFGGRIVEMLPPDVPLEGAEHPYTRALVAAVPRLDAMALPEVEVREGTTALAPEGCPFRDRCRLASEICTAQDPPLRPGTSGVVVACHHAGRTP